MIVGMVRGGDEQFNPTKDIGREPDETFVGPLLRIAITLDYLCWYRGVFRSRFTFSAKHSKNVSNRILNWSSPTELNSRGS